VTANGDCSTMAKKGGLLNEEILGDPRQHELQYANRVPFEILSALAISSQDVDNESSHCKKSI